ncbi:MAG: SRPBCC domain-containing protein [Acidimicrobiales bacterium]
MPFRRLVFTYGWESGGFPVPVGSSIVSIELTAHGDATEVSVVHEGLSDEMAIQHTEGWAMFVDRLAQRALAGGS